MQNSCLQILKFTSREMDALSMEWKHLDLQDIPEIPYFSSRILESNF